MDAQPRFSSAYIDSQVPGRRHLVQIRTGCYIEPLDAQAPVWHNKATVTTARCLAAMHCSGPDAVLAREAAAHMHGLGTFEQEPDVAVHQPTAPSRAVHAFEVVSYPVPPDQGHSGLPGSPDEDPRRRTAAHHRGPSRRSSSARHAGTRPPTATRQAEAPGRQAGRLTRLHRYQRTVAEEDVVEIGGIRVTSLELTVVDCLRSCHPRDALVIADQAMHRVTAGLRRGDPEIVVRQEAFRTAILHRLDSLGRGRGVRRARTIIKHASAGAESVAESALRWIILQAGYPPPVLQQRIRGVHGVYWVDLAWPDHRLIVEMDGLSKYSSQERRTLEEEKVREDDLRRAGLVIRFIWRDLIEVVPVLRTLRQVFPEEVVRNLKPVPGLAA